jgi:hypothetical protein
MVQLAHEYPDAFAPSPAVGRPAVAQLRAFPNGQQLVAQILWAHNVLLMQRVKDRAARHQRRPNDQVEPVFSFVSVS